MNPKKIDADGYMLVPTVFTQPECEQILESLEHAMSHDTEQFNVRESRGTVFAARNIVEICPDVLQFWRKPVLQNLLREILGDTVGLVRTLYFDKPSHRSWSLPYHKDMTIAVRDNSLASDHFCKPTHKAGVDHVEAPEDVLKRMLTLRIHLDGVTEDNGPLQVIPGSHLDGKNSRTYEQPPRKVLCEAGDVLAMRPLISHGSAHSNPEKKMHRRILHFEFSGVKELPDGYQWQTFES